MTVHHASQRILIVDDDPSCRELLDGLFELHGFQVTHTDSVLGASELIARHRPTVILLDLTLPYRSGASWLAQLKANPVTANIPVVVLSDLPDMLPRERREFAGAVVQKPFRAGALVQTVRAVCARANLLEADVTNDRASTPRQESP